MTPAIVRTMGDTLAPLMTRPTGPHHGFGWHSRRCQIQ
jgi:hypothetical protein